MVERQQLTASDDLHFVFLSVCCCSHFYYMICYLVIWPQSWNKFDLTWRQLTPQMLKFPNSSTVRPQYAPRHFSYVTGIFCISDNRWTLMYIHLHSSTTGNAYQNRQLLQINTSKLMLNRMVAINHLSINQQSLALFPSPIQDYYLIFDQIMPDRQWPKWDPFRQRAGMQRSVFWLTVSIGESDGGDYLSEYLSTR